MTVKTVGLDLAKDIFQVHDISENGRVIFNKAIKRANLLAFLRHCRVAQLAWKPADHRTFGVARCDSLATMSG
jgi:transposase